MYPRTFHDFYEQFPNVIAQTIVKARWADFDDVPDWEQEILSELIQWCPEGDLNPHDLIRVCGF